MGFYEDQHKAGYPLVIFGASILGEVALKALAISGLHPVCFGDNDREKQKKLFHGYPVYGMDELQSKYPAAIIVIAAGRYYDKIYDQISRGGYRQIYSEADIINQTNFTAVPYNQIKGILWRLAQLGHLSKIQNIPQEALHLERLNIVVTKRCTLNCRHCSSLMPFYNNPHDCDTELLLESIERILACIDFIYHVEVLGGETFMNRDLPLIIKKLTQSKNILQIDIITNGTIVPRQDLLDYLKHDNICVVVNDYGPLSNKKNLLLDALNKAGIKNRQNKHWAWSDLGTFEPRHRCEAGLTSLFQKCNFNKCSELLDGMLYRCPRSSHGTNTGLIPKYTADFFNVMDLSVKTDILKKCLRAFFHNIQFIHACDHCNGNTDDSLNLIPAEQLTQGECQ